MHYILLHSTKKRRFSDFFLKDNDVNRMLMARILQNIDFAMFARLNSEASVLYFKASFIFQGSGFFK